jgi:hypothetical protein
MNVRYAHAGGAEAYRGLLKVFADCNHPAGGGTEEGQAASGAEGGGGSGNGGGDGSGGNGGGNGSDSGCECGRGRLRVRSWVGGGRHGYTGGEGEG